MSVCTPQKGRFYVSVCSATEGILGIGLYSDVKWITSCAYVSPNADEYRRVVPPVRSQIKSEVSVGMAVQCVELLSFSHGCAKTIIGE